MIAAGFDIKPTQSAICAVMLYDAKLSQIYAARMLEEGIYVSRILLSCCSERSSSYTRTVISRTRTGTFG